MKRDFSQALTHLDGHPLALELNADGSVKTPATLGKTAITALMAPKIVEGQAQLISGPEALLLFDLSMRIHQADGLIDVSAEETTLIKERIASHFVQPLVVGQAIRMLES